MQAELRRCRATMRSGFARMERHFELLSAWHVETCAVLRGEVQDSGRRLKSIGARFAVVAARLEAAEAGVAPPRSDARRYRRWAEREFAAAVGELDALQQDVQAPWSPEQQAEVDQLAIHVADLERRLREWRRWKWRDFT